MPVRRGTIVLTYTENTLTPSGTQAGVAGENGAVCLQFDIPPEMEGLNVKLQVIAEDGTFDESAYATSGRIEMPLRAGVLIPGWLRVLARASDGTGVRLSAGCALWVQSSPGLANAVATAFPQDFEELQQRCESILNQSLDGGVVEADGTLGGRWLFPQMGLSPGLRASGTLVLPARLRAFLVDGGGAITGEVVGDGVTAVKDLPTCQTDRVSLGIDRVDNTADMEKPVSAATQAALQNIKSAISKSVTNAASAFYCGCDDGGAEKVRVKDGLQADLSFTAAETVSGLTVTVKNPQVTTNGNFANGTAGWSGLYASLSANSSVLSATGDGTGASIRVYQNITGLSGEVGRKIFVRARIKVSDATATSLSFAVSAGNAGGGGAIVAGPSGFTPVSGAYVDCYGIYTFTSNGGNNWSVRASADYGSASKQSGKSVGFQDFFLIDLGTADHPGPLYAKTSDKVAALFPGYSVPAAVTLTLGDFAAGDTFARKNGAAFHNGAPAGASGDYIQYLGGTVKVSAASGTPPVLTSVFLADVFSLAV